MKATPKFLTTFPTRQSPDPADQDHNAYRELRQLPLKLAQPLVTVCGYEGVVDKPRVGGDDAGEFFGLSQGECFMGVEAPGTGKVPAAQDFVNARDAACEAVSGVEDGSVGVRECRGTAD